MSDLKQQAEAALIEHGELAYIMLILNAARERIGRNDMRVQMLAGHMWDGYISITDLSAVEEKLLRHKAMQEAAELLEDLLDLEEK